MSKVKVTIGDKTLEGEQVAFETTSEPWSSYRLADGNVVKMKLVVAAVIRLPDKDPVTGLPQYLINSTNVVSIEPSASKSSGH